MESKNPLLGKYDLDPGRWRPLHYGVEIDVALTSGATESGTIKLNNQPFILTRITHEIVGRYVLDPLNSWLENDGHYSVEWKDENSNYQNQPIVADLMWGRIKFGGSIELPFPIPYAGNKTLTFRVQNRRLRVSDTGATLFRVGIVAHGVADWGIVQPRMP
jgi:hypothetical protein